MKNLKTIFVLAVLAVTITSCKNTDREQVETSVDNYITYVDSVTNVALEDTSQRWDEIENSVKDKRNEAENWLHSIEEKSQYEEKIEESSKKYDAYRQDVLIEKQKADATRAKQSLRNSLFKDTNIGNDLNFNWVNKDNILNVYDHFVTTVSNYKDSYSQEEWDEIKLLYEALDSRKNTVEKEGLTNADNIKIAALKVQFAPVYKINKFQAKSEENKK
ncbi:MAG TPA: hypothetical protein VLZ72_00725 [Flavobacterium sp.]|nr:hypothetical protein [Flavobacterium sp.]